MPAQETLSAISQLGVAFAAFVAIFFAFSRGLGEFSIAQKLRIRTILCTCFWVMFVGMLPLALAEFFSQDLIFRVAAFIALIAFMAIGIDSFMYVKNMSKSQRSQVKDLNFYLSWALAIFIQIAFSLVAFGIFPNIDQGIYLLGALGGLALCTSNFLTLAFERLFKNSSDDKQVQE